MNWTLEWKMNAMLTPLVFGTLGIQNLATAYTSTLTTDANGKTDGTTGQSEDLWFATDPSLTRQVNPLEIAEDLRALPELQGYGNVASLRQVMAQQAQTGNTHLKDLVAQFGTLTDRTARAQEKMPLKAASNGDPHGIERGGQCLRGFPDACCCERLYMGLSERSGATTSWISAPTTPKVVQVPTSMRLVTIITGG